jgi:hypothetical protein
MTQITSVFLLVAVLFINHIKGREHIMITERFLEARILSGLLVRNLRDRIRRTKDFRAYPGLCSDPGFRQ